MRLGSSILLVLLCQLGSALAAEPVGKLVRETWDSAFLDGQKAGYFHTTVREISQGNQTILSVVRELRLTVRRGPDIARIEAETGDEETTAGELLSAHMTVALGAEKKHTLSGRVENGMLKLLLEGADVPGGKFEKQIPVPGDLLTLLGEENLLKNKKAKPGDRLSYRLFVPEVNNVVRVEITVKEREWVPLHGEKRLLLRVEGKPEKIQGVQLPSQSQWYDEQYNLVFSQTEMPPLGELTLHRTTKQQALAPLGKLRDLGDQSIALDRPISDAHRARKIVYRVTFAKDIDDLAKSFAEGDDRQEIKNVDGRSLELHVTAVRSPPRQPSTELISKDFLTSNFFINSDDEVVQKHAQAAVGRENDPWMKSRAIERWVKQNMKPMVFTEAMAPADHVARTLTGDCTEYAMLAAAMCRAQGIPSRTAIGAVYYLDKGQPKLGYHMWTEVWVRGQWLAIDATLGYGSVGAAHIKITDSSWHEVRSMTPLLPVMRVLSGKPRMEVLRVERD
jgi:Transglutaminase-like superfamily